MAIPQSELTVDQRISHNSEQMERIQQCLEEIAQLRTSGRSWGEVKVAVIWRDGLIEEFRVDQGDVIRCPAVATSGAATNGTAARESRRKS